MNVISQDEILKMQMNQRFSINSHLLVEETSGDIVKMPSAATTNQAPPINIDSYNSQGRF
jgi:hypothetical protein